MKHTVTEVKFKNGSKGLLVHIPDATVMTFDLNFRAGEYLVKQSKWETPHLMEHMLLGANEQFPRARTFQAEFEKNGAYNNATTNVYEISYEAECADFEWERIMGLLHLAITKPLFLEEEFRAEYGNVREELTSRSNNHFRYLSLALREAYGFKAKTDQERLKLIKNVTLEDIKAHYERTHTSANLRFVVAGNITPKRLDAIKEAFSKIDLPRGTVRRALPTERPKTLADPLYIVNRTVDNLYFYIDTFMQRRLTDSEADALELLNTMLTETFYSRILGTARERGLVYHISSGVSQTKVSGNWWFGAQVLPANAAELFGIVVTELHNICDGQIDQDEIAAAKAYGVGRFQRSAQTVGGTAGGYAGRYFFDGVIDDYYRVPERIKAVTKTAIIDVARAMFADKTWGFGVLGNCGVDLVRGWQSQLDPLWSEQNT